jgi:hypothetical protein
MHTWPAEQAGPLPQAHWPLVQLSANVELHVVQAPPPLPQLVSEVGVSQVLPLQQPDAQV